MQAKDKRLIGDRLTQLMLLAATVMGYQKGLYADYKEFGANKTRAEQLKEKLNLLKQSLINQFDDSFKPEVTKKINASLEMIENLSQSALERTIENFNQATATGKAVDVFTDNELDDLALAPLPEKKKHAPKHIVLSGGGIKGVANETVFETLENNGLLQGIDECYGSSVGGLTAALLALGYNVEDMKKNMEVNKNMLLDPYRHARIAPFETAAYMVKNLVNHAGIAKGYKLFELAQNAVAQKLGNPNATFADLERKFGQPLEDGGKFRHLTVTATVKDPRRGFYQVVLNAQTVPNMPIALALRMTAGLPPAFRSVELTPEELAEFRKGATKPLVQYDRGENFPPYDPNNPQDEIPVTVKKRNAIKFIDGGVTDNLPLYLPFQQGANGNEIIAINYAEPWRLAHLQKNKEKYAPGKVIKSEDEKNWLNSALMRKNDFLYYLYQRKRYLKRPAIPPQHVIKAEQANAILNIPTEDVSAADFDLSEDKKEMLRQNGAKEAEAYLRKHGITPKVVNDSNLRDKVTALHAHHELVLMRAKEFLLKNFNLHNNEEYKRFKKHVDNTGTQLDIAKGITLRCVKIANVKFTQIYKMRNEASAALLRAKRECNIAQRILYGWWKRVPLIKKIVKKVDVNLNRHFEEFYEFNGVIKALNSALKAQRPPGMEVAHKKYSPYKDRLLQSLKPLKQSITTRLANSKKTQPKK